MQCLGRGNNPESKALSSWDMVCKPWHCGGLGILDFEKQNEGLLIKHLHKFYNKKDVPWVNLVWRYYSNSVPHASKLCGSFRWRDTMKLADKYRNVCTVKIGARDSTLFWSDNSEGMILQDNFPRLFSFSIDANRSVKEVILNEDITSLF
jgi:hypothetical protein